MTKIMEIQDSDIEQILKSIDIIRRINHANTSNFLFVMDSIESVYEDMFDFEKDDETIEKCYSDIECELNTISKIIKKLKGKV